MTFPHKKETKGDDCSYCYMVLDIHSLIETEFGYNLNLEPKKNAFSHVTHSKFKPRTPTCS